MADPRRAGGEDPHRMDRVPPVQAFIEKGLTDTPFVDYNCHKGGVLMTQHLIKIHTTISRHMLLALDEEAERREMSRAMIIRQACAAHLIRSKDDKKKEAEGHE
jgi:DNA-binding LacI/PurR family transcriptional regulator